LFSSDIDAFCGGNNRIIDKIDLLEQQKMPLYPKNSTAL
jgi:hypothetical protein